MTTLADLLTLRAGYTPEVPAVGGLTYASLEGLAAGVAGRLRRQGVRPGDRVGLHFPPSVEATVGVHGILRAGAVCVPLDPALPPVRRKALAADAGLWALVGAEPMGALPLVKPLGRPGTAPAERLPADAPAYLLYTSGSTGRPKAVTLTHGNVLTFVRWASAHVGPKAGDRVAGVASLGFDLSLYDLFATAAGGATLVPLPPEALRRPAAVARWLDEQGISVLYATPTVLQLLLGEPRPGLRLVLFAGEPFPPERLPDLRRTFPNARLANLYGPTETNVVTWHEVGPDHVGPIPIGRACDHAEVSVRDRLGQPAESGELWVRGPSVTPGYWRRPVHTARAFAGSWYRTGDMVRQDPDGVLHFRGRRDRMAKIRGQRVEPGEVEAALMRHPDVKLAAVVVADGALHAYVAGKDLDGLDLRKHLVRRLPPVMIPRRLEILEDLPRTASGKLDRRALRRRASTPAAPSPAGADARHRQPEQHVGHGEGEAGPRQRDDGRELQQHQDPEHDQSDDEWRNH